MGEGGIVAAMFSDLITWYLFLGGLGSGAFLVYCVTEVLAARTEDGWRYLSNVCLRPVLVVSLGALLVGCVCLLKDMARTEQVLLVFARVNLSPLSIGALSLTGLMVCLVLLIMSLYHRRLRRSWAVPAAKALGVVLSLVVMTYTGFFLSGIAAVPLWTSPALPALFVLSSLSSGIAVVLMVVSCQVLYPKAVARQMAALLKADGVLIVLEVACLAVMYFQLGGSEAAQLSFESLVLGAYQIAFVGGFLVCGLALPLALELAAPFLPKRSLVFYIFVGSFILVGAFFLRYCAINAGVHLSLFMLGGP